MKKGELPGYTDWEKFTKYPELFRLVYNKDDLIIFKLTNETTNQSPL